MAQLYVETLGAPEAPAHVLFTHGIYGAGGNWRSIARAVVAAQPRYGAVLVDLRGHGRSPQGEPPHTLDACAGDLDETLATLVHRGVAVTVACGHSFGGKVLMALRARRDDLAACWILDSSPSTRPGAVDDPSNTVQAVLAALGALPPTLPRRDDFIAALVAAGQTPALASWLAMNVVPEASGGYRLRLDLSQMRELLADYYRRDLWDAILAPGRGELHMVVAQRSPVVSEADRARLREAAAALPHLGIHELPDAGHWLHIDQPRAVAELIASRLPTL
ncbi:MAG: alpha/beta hydrolase [Myxococcales bacterium]|nr:alpha/beta hydrolase [Myxococcales bacterium]